jgi:hypothetical protein
MVDANDLKVSMRIQDVNAVPFYDVLRAIRDDLKSKLPLAVFDVRAMVHLLPAFEAGTSRDELRELLTSNFLDVFDAACLEHFVERIEVGIFFDESVRE